MYFKGVLNGSTTKDIIPKRIIPKHVHQKSSQVTKQIMVKIHNTKMYKIQTD